MSGAERRCRNAFASNNIPWVEDEPLLTDKTDKFYNDLAEFWERQARGAGEDYDGGKPSPYFGHSAETYPPCGTGATAAINRSARQYHGDVYH